MRSRSLLLGVLCLALMTLSACGDEDGGATPPLPTSTPTSTRSFTPTSTLAPSATQTSSPLPTATPTSPPPPPTQTPTSIPTSTSTATAIPTASATPTATVPLTDAERLMSVAQKEEWNLAGLTDEVQILRTEGNVPHIYASNRHDLAFAQGFEVARDRYFMMELTRRLGLGKVTELIGDNALDTDLESRLTGLTYVADRIVAGFDPEQAELADAFAAGVNAYVEQAKARKLPLPSELRLASALLGVTDPRQLLSNFTRRDIAGILAVIVYQSSYETGDIGRTAAYASVDGSFVGAPFEELRRAGLKQDVAGSVAPFYPVGSSAGFGLEIGDQFIPGPLPPSAPLAPGRARSAQSSAGIDLAKSLAPILDRLEQRLGRVDGFGSNSWAVAGAKTHAGETLVAGDGHLGLDVPCIFFQLGLDTSVLGGGSIHQLGLVIPGFFVMPVGTNGHVGWSQTQLSSDLNDWYNEQIHLDANGLPSETLFQGTWQPVQRHDESFVIANVPALGSEGRTETWPRFTLFDGRWLAEIEGRRVSADEPIAEGESRMYTMRGLIVPGDTDGDGVISAISFDYTAFDIDRVLAGADGFGQSANVEEFRQHAKKLIGYSQNIVAGDDSGDILYTSYNAVPCRGYLPRQQDGHWAPGANPQRLLDGTQYGGFEVPKTNGLPDENAAGDDPYRCIVPFDSTPQSVTPSRGYVLTANNDPAAIQRDGSLEDDPWYIGGSWDVGFRAHTIDKELSRIVAEGHGDADAMAELQSNHESRLGENFSPFLAEAIGYARTLQMVDRILSPAEQRAVELYSADSAAFDEVKQRIDDWATRGFDAASGVASFYHTPTADDAQDAVATMIFNAWIGRFMHSVWDDEPFNTGVLPEGDMTRLKLIHRFLKARDAGNNGGFASFNPDTGESIYFDIVSTGDVETSREMMLRALRDALAFLRAAPIEAGRGGFGTDDMSKWVWGLRHQVKFESLLAPFLGNNPDFEVFTRPFAIDTSKLPLAPNLSDDDPRKGLRWFPRHGDQWGVDAANPGLGGTDFTHGSGAVMRMVFALKDGHVSGYNIIPGGQSGLTDSAYFADQAALWLGNKAFPVRFHVPDVVAGATGREALKPKLATGRCHSETECTETAASCVEPGGFVGCGACRPVETNECETDLDCGEPLSGHICEDVDPSDCVCGGATKICKQGCDGSNCGAGEVCEEDQRCRPAPCTEAADCPPNFDCGGTADALTCARRGCVVDRDCRGGFCVEGLCYAELGTCMLPVP